MRQFAGFLMATAAAAALAACATPASQPPAAAAAPPPAPVVAVATAPAGNAPAAATKPVQKDSFTIPYGYQKVVATNGDVRYCRNDTSSDSRLAHSKVCMSKEQLEASQNDTRDYMNQLQRQGGSSTTQMTPGSGGAMGGR
jgi:hypothetical protein